MTKGQDCSDCTRERKTVFHAIDFASTFGAYTKITVILFSIIIYKVIFAPVFMTAVYTIATPLGSESVRAALSPFGNMLLNVFFGFVPPTGDENICGALAKSTCGYFGCLIPVETA